MASRVLSILMQARDGMSGAFNTASRSAAGLSRALSGVRSMLVGLASTATVGAMLRAYSTQEKAEQRLASALEARGEATAHNIEMLKESASALQRMSTVGDEATVANQALALSMGATVKQAEQIAKSAADMSVALGITGEAATRNLSKTLGGLKGELGEIVPELRAMTAEQLKSGAAIDIVAEKFRGFAERESKTFGGQLQQLWNAVGDAAEVAGQRMAEALGNANAEGKSLLQTLTGLVEQWTFVGKIQGEQRKLPSEYQPSFADRLIELNDQTRGGINSRAFMDFFAGAVGGSEIDRRAMERYMNDQAISGNLGMVSRLTGMSNVGENPVQRAYRLIVERDRVTQERLEKENAETRAREREAATGRVSGLFGSMASAVSGQGDAAYWARWAFSPRGSIGRRVQSAVLAQARVANMFIPRSQAEQDTAIQRQTFGGLPTLEQSRFLTGVAAQTRPEVRAAMETAKHTKDTATTLKQILTEVRQNGGLIRIAN